MEKDHFKTVLQRYSASSQNEAEEVISLKESFPYSQLLHALSARLSKDHGFSNQQAELQLAAVYAADRGVLKEVMTVDMPVVSDTPPTAKAAPSATRAFKVPPAKVISEDLAEEVIHDLERLHELKHNFEMMFVDGESTSQVRSTPTTTRAKESEVTESPEHSTKESSKSKKERIIELAKALQHKEQAEPEESDHAKPSGKKKKKDAPGEELIDEIISTKQEIVPENEKQKEQIEIIDQFIKSQPSISPAKDKVAGNSGDLATIKTGEFGDNVVSETLVEILIKQGKKDKAIEVLKKLIWKFPQKKAYFAAQIEDLKK
ncbi:MAG TPA: hypothetical protein VGK59_20620 [Ohtaekwangia sp.]